MSRLLTAGQVSQETGVSSRTISEWADAGKIKATRTLGGHRRFDEREVLRIKRKMEKGGPR